MGLQRRKVNQLAEAEVKATQEILAERQQGSKQRQPLQQQPRSPVVSYFITVALACVFWVVFQQLHKYSMHMAKPL